MSVKFNRPCGIAVDENGAVYVADTGNHRIRVIRDGQVSTLAGEGAIGYLDGPSAKSWFHSPEDVAVGPNGIIYVAGEAHNRLRAIRNGQVCTLGPKDKFHPRGVATGGDKVYATDLYHQEIVSVATTTSSFVARATSKVLSKLAVHGDSLYFLDGTQVKVFRGGQTATLPSGATRPRGIAVGADGSVYVADEEKHLIRVIRNGQISTLAGCGTCGFLDGEASQARFHWPCGIAVDRDGTVYVADCGNNRIRLIRDGRVSTLAGCGTEGFEDGPAFPSSSKTLSAKMPEVSASVEKCLRVATNFGIDISSQRLEMHKSYINLRCPALVKTSPSLSARPVDAKSIEIFLNFLYSDRIPDNLDITQLLGVSYLLFVADIKPHAYSLLTRLQEYPATETQKKNLSVQQLVQGYCYSLDLLFQEGRQVALYVLQKHASELKPHMKNLPDWLGKHAGSIMELVQELIGSFDASKVPITPSMLATKGNFLNVSETLEKLYTERSSADFELVTQGGPSEKVHSYVLYAMWPYFRRMYDANMKEKNQGRLVLPSVDTEGAMTPEVLQLIVALCYKPNMLRDTAKHSAPSLPMAIQLLSSADLYFFDLDDDPSAEVWTNLLDSARITVVRNLKTLKEKQDPKLLAIQSLPAPMLYELLLSASSLLTD